MKKVLLLYPHRPPSNLVGVQRIRHLYNHLHQYGWYPYWLCVSPEYYEEPPDPTGMEFLVGTGTIIDVKAFSVGKPRLIGDIGIRAFIQLYQRGHHLIRDEKIDCLFVSLPSFYLALLARLLSWKTGIPYVVDYQDPWVHDFPGSEKWFSRAWLSTILARILEPIAVKKASLLTGISRSYFEQVFERNRRLKFSVRTASFPVGFDPSDFNIRRSDQPSSLLFQPLAGKFIMVYAGAMLPRAYTVLDAMFSSLASSTLQGLSIEMHFIGTGNKPGDANAYTLRPLAEKHGLWKTLIHEHPLRIPYPDALAHLRAASGIFILGSTEPHYSPSKVYQAVLSGKPILAVLHEQSTAVEIIRKTGTGRVLTFRNENDLPKIRDQFAETLRQFIGFAYSYQANSNSCEQFEPYTAKSITGILAEALDEIVVDG